MNTQPTVSILMPVYNGAEYLRPAIDCLLKQTFSDFELIIVNDGSTDNTQEIIDSYDDARIVCLTQENQGVARSLNNGLQIARGKYVRRHDADDVSLPDSLQKQVDFLEAHPDYVMVSNQQAFMTYNGKIAYKFRMPHNRFFEGKPWKDVTFDDFDPGHATPIVHGTACYKRQEVMEIGAYRPEFIVGEDNDLWIRLLEKIKIAVLNECNYFVRIHPGSATQRHAAKIKHFRRLIVAYSEERRRAGSDPIMRGEAVGPPPQEKPEQDNKREVQKPKGRYFREDMRYMYSLVVNARDWKLAREIGGQIFKDGWKVPGTYKMLLFPLLGDSLVNTGVKVKGVFRKSQETN
jgi:glycosyltransferase involved in cell wall biosynthesis